MEVLVLVVVSVLAVLGQYIWVVNRSTQPAAISKP